MSDISISVYQPLASAQVSPRQLPLPFIDDDPQAWLPQRVFLPRRKPRRLRVGKLSFILADCRCRVCGAAYGPFRELWAENGLCMFCCEELAGAA